MLFPSEAGVRWAVTAILEWRSEVKKKYGKESEPRPLTNFFRFFILKFLGTTTTTPESSLTTADFRSACRQLIQVSFPDGTADLTDGDPRYFNPITALYPRAASEESTTDYAIGTMWTRCQSWKDAEYIRFTTEDGGRPIAFEPGYLDKLKQDIREQPLPALALAMFFFRRPSDYEASPTGLNDAASFISTFIDRFHLEEAEKALFDLQLPALPDDWSQNAELTREEVLHVLLDVVPLPVSASDATATVAATDAPNGGQVAAVASIGTPEPTHNAALPETPEFSVTWALAKWTGEDPCGLSGLGSVMMRVLTALSSRKHVILYGPPGTGKTRLAECICNRMRVEFDVVTATSDWTTFDTIGGYLPDPQIAGSGSEPLNFFPGVFLQAVENRRWLVVDELNRADIDKAFGELFTVLSLKSGDERPIRLPFKSRVGSTLKPVILGNTVDPSAHVISVPPDWRLIGTMNTFDKASLYQLSYAFMRRFAFVYVPVPERATYEAILLKQATGLKKSETDSSFHDEVVKHFKALFAPAPDTGLAKHGLIPGPAIPVDMVRYVQARFDLSDKSLGTNDARDAVLEASEMYLYPQYEGRNRQHKDILKAIGDALGLADPQRATTGRVLETWTGYDRVVGDRLD